MLVREILIDIKEKSKTAYNRNQNEIVINVGDNIFIKNHYQNGKLGPKWLDPYKALILQDNENVKILQKEKKSHYTKMK